MSDRDRAPIIAKMLDLLARYKAADVGVESFKVRSARLLAVAEALMALSEGNEDNITRSADAEIVYGLGAPERTILWCLFFPPDHEPDPLRLRVTAELLPVVEAMFSVGMPDPGWADIKVEIVDRSWWR